MKIVSNTIHLIVNKGVVPATQFIKGRVTIGRLALLPANRKPYGFKKSEGAGDFLLQDEDVLTAGDTIVGFYGFIFSSEYRLFLQVENTNGVRSTIDLLEAGVASSTCTINDVTYDMGEIVNITTYGKYVWNTTGEIRPNLIADIFKEANIGQTFDVLIEFK